jgi:hypothetical protein
MMKVAGAAKDYTRIEKTIKTINADIETSKECNEKVIQTFKQIKDKVFPSIEEIHFCLRKKLVSKKETILYKLILDFNEAIFATNPQNIKFACETLIPCC